MKFLSMKVLVIVGSIPTDLMPGKKLQERDLRMANRINGLVLMWHEIHVNDFLLNSD